MHARIYLSDEGYGHIVRQRAVLEQLRKLCPELSATVLTHAHADAAARIIPEATVIDRFNNIRWDKQANGSPDITAIAERFSDYEALSDRYIAKESAISGVDFIVSDFVYEAFAVGHNLGIPAFGVAHFTWDWFFSKLYPPPITTRVMTRFFTLAKSARRIYFPPFTPEEIIRYYKDNMLEVPLILRSGAQHKHPEANGKLRVLLLDSGSGLLGNAVSEALDSVKELDEFQFFVSSSIQTNNQNVCFIDKNELMVDYVKEMDLVIARAGFNTISECIGLRTPILLIGEAMNPEINENIINLKKVGLGSFISLETFRCDLATFLPHFIAHEYKTIAYNMANHDMPLNGAEVIANDILDQIS